MYFSPIISQQPISSSRERVTILLCFYISCWLGPDISHSKYWAYEMGQMIYPKHWISESTPWPQICCSNPKGLVSKALLVGSFLTSRFSFSKSTEQSSSAYKTRWLDVSYQLSLFNWQHAYIPKFHVVHGAVAFFLTGRWNFLTFSTLVGSFFSTRAVCHYLGTAYRMAAPQLGDLRQF